MSIEAMTTEGKGPSVTRNARDGDGMRRVYVCCGVSRYFILFSFFLSLDLFFYRLSLNGKGTIRKRKKKKEEEEEER